MAHRIALACLAFLLGAAGGTAAAARNLTFDERGAAAEAVERVAHAHRVGDPGPFERAVPRSVLEERLRRQALDEALLERFWGIRLQRADVEREARRMLRGSRMPFRLREIADALGGDAFLFQECVARPAIASRLLRQAYAGDPRFHADARARIEDVRRSLAAGRRDVTASGVSRQTLRYVRDEADRLALPPGTIPVGPEEWASLPDSARTEESDVEFAVSVVVERSRDEVEVVRFAAAKQPLEVWRREVADVAPSPLEPIADVAATMAWPAASTLGATDAPCSPDDTWHGDGIPEPRNEHLAFWTGSVMLVWGGQGPLGMPATGGRYDPALDTWEPMTRVNAPQGRRLGTGVWTGTRMIVWGGLNGTYLNTGGSYDPVADAWSILPTTGAPTGRIYPTAVWTGTEVIVWGGYTTTGYGADGARYRPATNSWAPMSATGAPSARSRHVAVWTGTRMVVWGGEGAPNDGGRYDPVGDVWAPVSTTGAPSARSNHTAVWTGTAMIVWGGGSNTGGRYEPVGDTWAPVSTAGAPSARLAHSAVWTGSRMIVWGGSTGSYDSFFDTGGSYDPGADTWTATPPGATPRQAHTAVWTGTEMIVWGGRNYYPGSLNTGYRLDPSTAQWRPVGPHGLPGPRRGHVAVWSGSEMLVWGGSPGRWTGGRYDPALDVWSALPTYNAPDAYSYSLGVWTGSTMIVWGGDSGSERRNTGRRYDPLRDVWLSISAIDAPSPRSQPKGAWTGTHLLVWGGYDGTPLQTGGRYDPATDTWSPITTVGAPTGRYYHTIVWSGSRMIAWGGYDGGGSNRNDGGRYDPVQDQWSPVSTTGAPPGRIYHTAVWTGNRMVVWGGQDSIALASGGRYDPVADSWAPISSVNAPAARYGHVAVWTGRRVLVWGGQTAFQSWFDSGGRYDPVADTWQATSLTNAPIGRESFTGVWTGSHLAIWGGYVGIDTNTGSWYALDHGLDGDGDGWTECGGDCNDSLAGVFPGATETCDGRDNDCDAAIDEGFATPGTVASLAFAADESMSWSASTGATGYDVVAGDLLGVRASGQFGTSVLRCVENDGADLAAADPASPAAGQGVYYLVRATAFCKRGKYGTGAPGEQPFRDLQIDTAAAACP